MDARTNEQLLAEVNRSGFPLQIAIEHLILGGAAHGWKVRYVEHEWKNERTGAGGYSDLVLSHDGDALHVVVECKRVMDTNWIFLRDRSDADATRAKPFISFTKTNARRFSNWEETHTKLSSPESTFAVSIGESKDNRPMLERVAAGLVQSVEALAAEDLRHGFVKPDLPRLYVPLVVTTAALKVCNYDASRIALDAGQLSEAELRDAAFVRFRKQLSAQPSTLDLAHRWDASAALAAAKESTVFVLNATSLIQFLNYFDVINWPQLMSALSSRLHP